MNTVASRDLIYMVLVILAAVAFGRWQNSEAAGVWMFCVLAVTVRW